AWSTPGTRPASFIDGSEGIRLEFHVCPPLSPIPSQFACQRRLATRVDVATAPSVATGTSESNRCVSQQGAVKRRTRARSGYAAWASSRRPQHLPGRGLARHRNVADRLGMPLARGPEYGRRRGGGCGPETAIAAATGRRAAQGTREAVSAPGPSRRRGAPIHPRPVRPDRVAVRRCGLLVLCAFGPGRPGGLQCPSPLLREALGDPGREAAPDGRLRDARGVPARGAGTCRR